MGKREKREEGERGKGVSYTLALLAGQPPAREDDGNGIGRSHSIPQADCHFKDESDSSGRRLGLLNPTV